MFVSMKINSVFSKRTQKCAKSNGKCNSMDKRQNDVNTEQGTGKNKDDIQEING